MAERLFSLDFAAIDRLSEPTELKDYFKKTVLDVLIHKDLLNEALFNFTLRNLHEGFELVKLFDAIHKEIEKLNAKLATYETNQSNKKKYQLKLQLLKDLEQNDFAEIFSQVIALEKFTNKRGISFTLSAICNPRLYLHLLFNPANLNKIFEHKNKAVYVFASLSLLSIYCKKLAFNQSVSQVIESINSAQEIYTSICLLQSTPFKEKNSFNCLTQLTLKYPDHAMQLAQGINALYIAGILQQPLSEYFNSHAESEIKIEEIEKITYITDLVLNREYAEKLANTMVKISQYSLLAPMWAIIKEGIRSNIISIESFANEAHRFNHLFFLLAREGILNKNNIMRVFKHSHILAIIIDKIILNKETKIDRRTGFICPKSTKSTPDPQHSQLLFDLILQDIDNNLHLDHYLGAHPRDNPSESIANVFNNQDQNKTPLIFEFIQPDSLQPEFDAYAIKLADSQNQHDDTVLLFDSLRAKIHSTHKQFPENFRLNVIEFVHHFIHHLDILPEKTALGLSKAANFHLKENCKKLLFDFINDIKQIKNLSASDYDPFEIPERKIIPILIEIIINYRNYLIEKNSIRYLQILDNFLKQSDIVFEEKSSRKVIFIYDPFINQLQGQVKAAMIKNKI